jgi:hypothetical protein
MVLPGGLIEGVNRMRDAWLRRLALREGIHVPSLVADSLVPDDPPIAPTADPTAVAAVADVPVLEPAR